MDQPSQRPSTFVAFLNPEKQPGDKRPMFIDGRIAKPGSTDEVPVVLWAFEYTDKETGEVLTGFSGSVGNVDTKAPAAHQIQALAASRPAEGAVIEHAGLKLKPGHIIAFVNKPKPDGKPNQKTHYGFVNFGDGTPLVDVSIWLGKDRYGRAMLSGNTQFPQPGKSEVQQPAPELDKLVANGAVTKGMPKKAADKGGRG